jgi:peptide/nickel transport system substrate-binding protein
MAPDVPDHANQSELLTFLIADIRSYTAFTEASGDEAAVRLTTKFASIIRDHVTEFDGTVLELRGDEALCLFNSPRQALRAAINVQQRFVTETLDDPNTPLAVGIGIDVGEAVRGADGYRGGALNLAARLCTRARAGEILASSEVTHLARTIEGIRYLPQDSVAFKGITDPVRLVRILPVDADPADQFARLAATTAQGQQRRTFWSGHPRRQIAAVLLAAALVAGAIGAAIALPGASAVHPIAALTENSAASINPSTGQLLSDIPVDSGPTAAASGFGAIWTANTAANTVSRIDTQTRAVTRIPVGSAPSALAVGLGSVWVADSGSASVSRIDPSSDQVQSFAVGTEPGGIAVAGGALWVSETADDAVSRIDPSTDSVTRTIAVGASPTGIAAGGSSVWVANSASNTVSELNAHTASVTETVHVGNDPQALEVAAQEVWVANNLDGTLVRIPQGGTSVTATVDVGAQPSAVVTMNGDLWVATQANEDVVEVDPNNTQRVIRRVRLGVVPGGLVAAGSQLWATVTVNPALHRGGTLRLRGGELGTIDPAYAAIQAFWLLNGSYDGLVALRHTDGAEGTELVPDLAAAIPDPTNNGRTYSFRLRKGIRWSNGKLLTGYDVRRGLERSIYSGVLSDSDDIVGARACTQKHCNVTGIRVDSAGDVAITLVRPDPGFLGLVASEVVAVPSNTPLTDQGSHPIAVTGPYEVARYLPHKIVVLKRNPYFHQWSTAAQPDGYPDEIDWTIDANAGLTVGVRAEMNDVATGRADWADARFGGSVSAIAARFGPRQLYVTPEEATYGVVLNTRVAPFNDVRVRRALAYAIDRGAAATDWPAPATITCQILPPNFPGYRPYCPYTLRPDAAGTWRAPDLATALRLVRRSHTSGMKVTVYSLGKPAPGMRAVVAALRDLHYRVTFTVDNPANLDAYFNYVADSAHKMQAAFFGTIAVDANPADFIAPLLTCASFVPDSVGNTNLAEFCDRAADHMIASAKQRESSSQAAADALWAGVDHKLTDEAPWIPLVSLSWVDVVSARVHNYLRSPVLGPLFDQAWVR